MPRGCVSYLPVAWKHNQPVFLSMNLPQLQGANDYTLPVRLDIGKKGCQLFEVEVRCQGKGGQEGLNSNRALVVHLEATVQAGLLTRIAIFVPFWVVDLTDLDLYLAPTPTSDHRSPQIHSRCEEKGADTQSATMVSFKSEELKHVKFFLRAGNKPGSPASKGFLCLVLSCFLLAATNI